jgi:hypothetical protein
LFIVILLCLVETCIVNGKILLCVGLYRLLVASMQSICLEGLGGEKRVDPRLQETTFIQHTFGGRLQSKVCVNPLSRDFIFSLSGSKSLTLVPLTSHFFDVIVKF